MSPVRLVDGRACRGGEPVVLIAPWWTPPATAVRARAQAREAAEAGFTALAVTEDAPVAADAARRAGLLLLVDGPCEPQPHVIAMPPEAARVGSVAAAYAALFASQPVLVGAADDLDGVARFVQLCGSPTALVAAAPQDPWLVAAGVDEMAAFTADGGVLELMVAAGQRLHWVDPYTGDILAIDTPHPDENCTVSVPAGEPMAVYLGPGRYQADDTPTRPD